MARPEIPESWKAFDEVKDVQTETLDCPMCAPFECDDPDNHLRHQIPAEYTPLANQGCHCGADFDGRDCMCFEDY